MKWVKITKTVKHGEGEKDSSKLESTVSEDAFNEVWGPLGWKLAGEDIDLKGGAAPLGGVASEEKAGKSSG